MSGPPGDEEVVLPQREPRARRKRVIDALSAEAGPAAPPLDGSAAAVPTDEAAGAVAGALGSLPAMPAGGEAPREMASADLADAGPRHARPDLQEYRSAAEPGYKFEYLDHTADVQLHAWGSNLAEAFENVGLCMFNYMTPLGGVAVAEGEGGTRRYEAKGHDLPSLLYHWLDELLFSFSTDFFVPNTLKITAFDRVGWRVEAVGRGERFDRQRHVSGTEIKAITYSAMQINEGEGDAEVFVIVDI